MEGVSTVSPFQFLDKNDYYLAYQPQERESTRVGEGSTVYSCYNESENRNLFYGCSMALNVTMKE